MQFHLKNKPKLICHQIFAPKYVSPLQCLFLIFRDKAGENFGWEDDEYTLNALISEDSFPLLADSECELVSEEKLTCVSPDIEGLLVNYGTTPASVTDFKAPIEFECTPKDGSSSEWTVENITWVKTVIPEILDPIFNYSSCKQPEYAQDSNCHDITNTPECNFDGGACCGDNVDKSYCIKCECKETCSLNRSESSDRIDGCFSKFFFTYLK